MIRSQRNPISFNGLVQLLTTFPLVRYMVEFFKDFVISIMKTAPIPKHVALIMDGNRRYAKVNNLPLSEGHTAGAESLVNVLNTCYKVGVQHVTIYAFSIENFNRSKEEVDTLFGLLRDRLAVLSENEESYARINNIRIKIVGNRSLIPQDILDDLEAVEEKTKNSKTDKVLNVCFPYTSRDDIVHSIKSVSQKIESGVIKSKEEVDLKTLTENMYMGPNTPPLDILVRTSGHTRLSDFMLWQCSENCTIEFVDTLWPDFKFFGIISILLRWSYYRTLEIEEQNIMGTDKGKKQKIYSDILKDLPAPPPFASVSQR